MNLMCVAAFCATLYLVVYPTTAGGQCCGDCDGDGAVRIDELVRAVAASLDACPADGVAVVAEATDIAHLASRLRRPIRIGRIQLTFTAAAEEDVRLVDLGMPNQFANRVALVKNGEFLRLVIAESGGRESDISVRIGGPGTRRVVAAWDTTSASLTIDDQLAGTRSLTTAAELAAGTLLEIGAVGSERYLQDVRVIGGDGTPVP